MSSVPDPPSVQLQQRSGSAVASAGMGPRRPTIRGSLLLGFLCLTAPGCSSGRGEPEAEPPYLHAARSVGLWLQRSADPERGGSIPDEASRDAPITPSLGSGAAGRVIFFLELHAATGDAVFLQSAEREGDAALDRTRVGFEKLGLYDGLAGVAFALSELGKVSGRTGYYRQAAEERFERLVAAADWSGDTVWWNRSNDILTGTAGIGLSLLYAAREFDNPAFQVAARAAGYALLGSAAPAQAGLRWSRFNDRELDLPNFSHGTAGVAYFLSMLAEGEDGDRFVAAAEAGADYLVRIADRRDGLLLVPYGVPNEGYESKYDIGWAHGPAGTGRLFFRLWQVTRKELYRDLAGASARSVLAAGVPGPTADPLLWSGPFHLDRRFGLAGVVPFLIDWYRVTGEQPYIDCARRSVDRIKASGSWLEDGLFWTLPREDFEAKEGKAACTNYFSGAAGFGLSLLEMHYAAAGGQPSIRLPDDPFPGSRAPLRNPG